MTRSNSEEFFGRHTTRMPTIRFERRQSSVPEGARLVGLHDLPRDWRIEVERKISQMASPTHVPASVGDVVPFPRGGRDRYIPRRRDTGSDAVGGVLAYLAIVAATIVLIILAAIFVA